MLCCRILLCTNNVIINVMKEFIKKKRCLSHKRYVRHAMARLHSEIAQDAIATGVVDLDKRKKLLKYKSTKERSRLLYHGTLVGKYKGKWINILEDKLMHPR